jgi:hypothetical protein
MAPARGQQQWQAGCMLTTLPVGRKNAAGDWAATYAQGACLASQALQCNLLPGRCSRPRRQQRWQRQRQHGAQHAPMSLVIDRWESSASASTTTGDAAAAGSRKPEACLAPQSQLGLCEGWPPGKLAPVECRCKLPAPKGVSMEPPPSPAEDAASPAAPPAAPLRLGDCGMEAEGDRRCICSASGAECRASRSARLCGLLRGGSGSAGSASSVWKAGEEHPASSPMASTHIACCGPCPLPLPPLPLTSSCCCC